MNLIPEESLMEALAAWQEHGTYAKAARALDLDRGTLRTRVGTAIRRGYDRPPVNPVPEGMEINRVSKWQGADGSWKESIRAGAPLGPEFEMPEGFQLRKGTYQLGPDGRVERSWPRVGPGERDPSELASILQEAFVEYKDIGAKPRVKPAHTMLEDRMAFHPIADLHMGLYSWHEETGNNWNLDKAMKVIREAFKATVDGSAACGTAVILGGGDQMHSDNNLNQTSRSGNSLDVDGRYPKVLRQTCHLFADMVNLCLRKHGAVTVRILPGNHDEHSSVAIAYFLLAWFRNEPRVTVDIDPSLFWWFRFGKVFLGATHGHQAKAKDMPMIMAARHPADWGSSKFRYTHGFHLHHKEMTKSEHSGVVTEIHASPAPQDGWHYGMGFLSGRCMTSIIYRESKGEVGRITEVIEDD